MKMRAVYTDFPVLTWAFLLFNVFVFFSFIYFFFSTETLRTRQSQSCISSFDAPEQNVPIYYWVLARWPVLCCAVGKSCPGLLLFKLLIKDTYWVYGTRPTVRPQPSVEPGTRTGLTLSFLSCFWLCCKQPDFFPLIGDSELHQLLQHLTKCWDVLCACVCMYKAGLIGRAFSFCLYMRIFVGSFYEHPEGFSENQNPWWMQLNGKSCQISYLRDIVCVLWFRYDKSAFWQPTQSGYPSQEGQFLIRCIQTELTLAGFRVFRDESYAVDFSK